MLYISYLACWNIFNGYWSDRVIKRDSVTKVADAHLVHRSDLRILWKSVACGSDTNADSTLFLEDPGQLNACKN
ncbi:uncharacterized protein METZ01_LOCUS498259, partial [marine metagenome]